MVRYLPLQPTDWVKANNMDSLTFLKRVLPNEGFYVTIIINTGEAPQQTFFPTMEELAASCLLSDKHKQNVYYAVSSFKTRGNRKQDNVHLTKTLFLDVDCGDDKPYANQKKGLAALLKFIQATGLPAPMIVSSGRGLHVYWVLKKGLAPADWKPLANALKEACVTHQFEVDPAITADNARVLRPVETHNPKNGKEVVVWMEAELVDQQTLQNILGYGKPTGETHLVTPVHKDTGLGDALSTDFTPALPNLILDGCRQLKWITENQKDVPEPLWYDMLGVAAHCVNPEDTAKLWSMKHPIALWMLVIVFVLRSSSM